MKHVLPLVLGLVMAAPAVAQKSGRANQNAPAVAQSVTMGDNKVSLNYTAIAWVRGEIVKQAMDKAGGAETRKQINDLAKSQPVGTFTTSVDLTCGDLKIPAGEYKLGFTINENCEWEINFMGKDTLTMKLPLTDNKEKPAAMLVCSLHVADRSSAGCYVAFGDKQGMLTFKPAGGAGGKKGG
jgi:hypothetical protein